MILTEADIEEFNIDRFVGQCVQCDCMDIVLRCQNVGFMVQFINPNNPDQNNEEVINFSRFIKHLLVIITQNAQAVKPMGMSDINFLKVRPLVEKLVATGYLKNTWLRSYAYLR